VTDRQTDRPRYSVGNNRPHLHNVVVRCRRLILTAKRNQISTTTDAGVAAASAVGPWTMSTDMFSGW